MAEYIELNTLAPKKWSGSFDNAEPLLDISDGVKVGDIAIDLSITPNIIWRNIDATDSSPVWVKEAALILDLINMFNSSKASNYVEVARDPNTGRLIQINVWTDITKDVLLYKQVRTFGTDISQVDYDRLITKTTTGYLEQFVLIETRVYEEFTLTNNEKIIVLKNKSRILNTL